VRPLSGAISVAVGSLKVLGGVSPQLGSPHVTILKAAGGAAPGQQQSGLGGLLEGIQGGSVGSLLGSGLGELIERFRQAGQGDVADSWVARGPNKSVDPPDLERALGADVLATLTDKTGLSREDILARLSRELPQAVDQYTPDGKLPAA
jgi:uncharacterized protein YidB (DUF937 family)